MFQLTLRVFLARPQVQSAVLPREQILFAVRRFLFLFVPKNNRPCGFAPEALLGFPKVQLFAKATYRLIGRGNMPNREFHTRLKKLTCRSTQKRRHKTLFFHRGAFLQGRLPKAILSDSID